MALLRGVDIKTTQRVGKSTSYKRRYVEFSGRRLENVEYIVHNNSHVNVLRALIERVYYIEAVVGGAKVLRPPPQPVRAFFTASMNEFQAAVWRELPPVQRMCLEKFVETSPPPKRAAYANAHECYIREGLEPVAATVNSFVKAEKVRIKSTKKDPVPRIIQPRGIKFNLIFGCFMRPLEKKLFHAIDRVYGRPTVVCGQNAEQQASMLREAWDELVDPVAISVDVSRFDQHVSATALRWQQSTYFHVYRNDPNLATLRWCCGKIVSNRGSVYTVDETGRKIKITYKKKGNRMSGDMDTSLGNKFLMCALLYSYFKSYLGFRPRVDFNVVNNGDDAVIILSGAAHARYLARNNPRNQFALIDPAQPANVFFAGGNNNNLLGVEPWFLRMGFTLKVEGTVRKFEKIEFCQTQPCYIDGRWIMVRRLDSLSKDCYCLKTLDLANRWLAQVRAGGLACYGSVPILSAFYGTMPDTKVEFDRYELYGTGMYYLAHNMTSSGVVSPENRISFYESFGVTPREQEVIEEAYRDMRYGKGHEEQRGLVLPLPV